VVARIGLPVATMAARISPEGEKDQYLLCVKIVKIVMAEHDYFPRRIF
jgi:hypothetical protein